MTDRDQLNMALAPGKDCLSIEQLDSIATGAEVPVHVEGCARCQAELALLRTFDSAEPLPGEGASVAWISAELGRRLPQIKGDRKAAEPKPWSRWWVRFAFSAAALAVVTVGVAIWMRPSEPVIVADISNHATL